jgi:FKBP-type peptidyl-prolyl cis-trans isomerase
MVSSSVRVVRFLAVVSAFVALAVTVPVCLRAAPRGSFTKEDEDIIQKKWPEAIEAPSGWRYVVLKEGSGPRPQIRQHLKVLYKGSLLEDGKQFDAKLDPNDPFVFTLGAGEVIVGWEEAFATMRAGEKRVIILPYALAYGLRGRPPDIPNRAALVFEVELLSIE